MIEIVNRKNHPVQLILRSTSRPRSFTSLNIPGRGRGMNTILIEDERWTDYIQQLKDMEWISTRTVTANRQES